MKSESAFLERIKQNDQKASEKAWNDLFDHYEQPVTSYIRTLNCRDQNDIDEVYQETLIRLHRVCHKLKLTSSFKTYLCSVAKYSWFELLRDRRKQRALFDYEEKSLEELSKDEDILAESDDPIYQLRDIPVLAEDKLNEVYVLLKKRKSTCENVIKKRFVQKLSLSEIAEELGMEYGAVKTKISNCKKTFRELLEQVGVQFPTSSITKSDE